VIVTISVCDLCQREVPIELSVGVEGTKTTWHVCAACERQPFRKPNAGDRAEAEMTMANALRRRSEELLGAL
jgi:hypothetical protein